MPKNRRTLSNDTVPAAGFMAFPPSNDLYDLYDGVLFSFYHMPQQSANRGYMEKAIELV
jgi:hypothetical protein